MEIVTWIAQGLLALAFFMAGLMKATQPKDKLKEKLGGWVDGYQIGQIKMIGLVEILGALGLVLPTALNISSFLTPLAAVGLAIIMVLAAALHARRKEPIIPNIVLLALLGFVIYSRWDLMAALLS